MSVTETVARTPTRPLPIGENAVASDADGTRRPRAAHAAERTGHPILRGIRLGVGYGILALTLLLATVVIIVPKLSGGIPLTILSGSMEPTLPVGSLAVVTPIEPDDVQVDDIITYLPNPDDPTAITHRVTAIDHHADGTRTFTTQGDANDAPDAPVQEQQVRAVVWYAVPLLGYVNTVVNGTGAAWPVYVVAGAFFLWALVLWTRAIRNRRARRQAVSGR